jgi:glycosyltransferase involved in cell wall biosynthesis
MNANTAVEKSSLNVDVLVIIRVTKFGGTDRHTIGLIRHMASMGISVAVIQSGRTFISEHLSDVVEFVRFIDTNLPMDETSPNDIRQWRALMCGLDAKRVVLVKGWFYVASASFVSLLNKMFPHVIQIEHATMLPRSKWSLGIHVNNGIRPGIWWYRERRKLRKLSRESRHVITVSEFNRQCLVEGTFISEKRIRVCRNGVNTSYWKKDVIKGLEFRQRLGISADSFVFACVGRLSPEKGFGLAIDAFKVLLERSNGEDIYLIIIGDGKQRDELQQRALQCGSRIIFVGFMEDMVSAYSAADAVLVTSDYEGYWMGESFGLALVEAMACECNVVAIARGAIPEVLGSQSAAYVVRTNNLEEITMKMEEVVGASRKIRAIGGRELRVHVREKFELSDRMTELVNAIVSSG